MLTRFPIAVWAFFNITGLALMDVAFILVVAFWYREFFLALPLLTDFRLLRFELLTTKAKIVKLRKAKIGSIVFGVIFFVVMEFLAIMATVKVSEVFRRAATGLATVVGILIGVACILVYLLLKRKLMKTQLTKPTYTQLKSVQVRQNCFSAIHSTLSSIKMGRIIAACGVVMLCMAVCGLIQTSTTRFLICFSGS